MGVVVRPDSPYFWLNLERPGQRPLRESTRILVRGGSPAQTKQNAALAAAAYAARMGDLARARYGLPAAGGGITFTAYADWYAAHHIAHHRGAEREHRILPHLRAFFGARPLTSITRDDAIEYRTARIAAGVAASTAERELNVLKSMLREAVGRHLTASPLVGWKRLRLARTNKRLVARDEEAALLDALGTIDDEMRGMYIVGVDTLLRLSNLVFLSRLEFRGTYLAVDTKTTPHDAPLSTRAARELRRRLPAGNGPFFPRWHAAFRKDATAAHIKFKRRFRRACVAAGITYGRKDGGTTWHTATRATGATRMLQAGVDARTVQAVGHWVSLDQMMAYLGINPAGLRPAVNQIAAPNTSHTRDGRRRAKSPR